MEKRIIIDADGCPVTRLCCRVAKEYGAQCVVVCDSAHIFREDELSGARVVLVSQGANSADFYIVNHAQGGDIIVTQDYGLAAMCLAKRCVPINQDGRVYSDENISGLLESRAANKKLLRSGRHPKGAPKRKSAQNGAFEKTLRRLLENAEI